MFYCVDINYSGSWKVDEAGIAWFRDIKKKSERTKNRKKNCDIRTFHISTDSSLISRDSRSLPSILGIVESERTRHPSSSQVAGYSLSNYIRHWLSLARATVFSYQIAPLSRLLRGAFNPTAWNSTHKSSHSSRTTWNSIKIGHLLRERMNSLSCVPSTNWVILYF